MNYQTLEEWKTFICPSIESYDIATEELSAKMMNKILRVLLFNFLVVNGRVVQVLINGNSLTAAPSIESLLTVISRFYIDSPVSGRKILFNLTAPKSNVNQWPIISEAIFYEAWRTFAHKDLDPLSYGNLEAVVNKADPSAVQMFNALAVVLEKLATINDTTRLLTSSNIPMRILDAIFPPAILNKLNSDWTKIPSMNRSDKFDATHVAMLKRALAPVEQDILSDDALAILIY